MLIRLEAFAVAREKLGFASQLATFDGPLQLGELVAALTSRHPAAALVFVASRYAVNGEYADLKTALKDQDTVSILPPVSGGAPRAVVSTEPIRMEEALAAVRSDAAGAVILFVGTVRGENSGECVAAMTYESKADMAERELERLMTAATERFGLSHAFIQHRIGRMAVGEISVVIATSAPHRVAAYDANRWLLEELKRLVPIWKREERERNGKIEEVWLGQGGG